MKLSGASWVSRTIARSLGLRRRRRGREVRDWTLRVETEDWNVGGEVIMSMLRRGNVSCDGGDEPVHRVRFAARHHVHWQAEVARGLRGDGADAGDDGFWERVILGQLDKVANSGRTGESDSVHTAFQFGKAARVGGGGQGAVGGNFVDNGPALRPFH